MKKLNILDSFKHFKDGNRYTLNFWVDTLPFVRRDAYAESPETMLKMGWIKRFQEAWLTLHILI